jgi:glycosyltransferase involved in cell wall biosynthesis
LYDEAMRLLMITQVVDSTDSNLGFFHRWIEEFARHCESVLVICLREGEHSLPPNVEVFSLGKEQGTSTLTRLIRFFRFIISRRHEYDAVFVHMNPEYIVLAGWLWKRWHKKVALWYAHKSVTWQLKRAVKEVSFVFTVSQTSFKVATPKLQVVGHGIDTEIFKPSLHEHSTLMRIITIGRIAESKHISEMLKVLDVLALQKKNFSFTIVGEATTPTEEVYKEQLRQEVEKRPYKAQVQLRGAVPHAQLPLLLNKSDVFFNFGTTGNMDKAGLEALAMELPLISTNEWFKEMLGPYGLYVPTLEPEAVAKALDAFMNRPDKVGVLATLRHLVVDQHSLTALIPKILGGLTS